MMGRCTAGPVEGAVFDCDGTLLDSMGVWIEMENHLARLAGHVLTDDEQQALRGYTLPETALFFHQKLGLGASARDVETMVLDHAVKFYRTKARARPGALEFVEALVCAGVRCSVVSSSPHAMLDPGLAANGFSGLFDIVVSTDDVGASKRTPLPFEAARRAMGTQLGATWVFEDSAYALKTARDAGYRRVGVWDKDESGTLEELRALADVAVAAWGDLDVEAFLRGGRRQGSQQAIS